MFDDANLVSSAGLVPLLRLAESAGLPVLLEEQLSVDSPAAAAKTACVVAGMLAGADSIDDLDLLRHGGMSRLFSGVRAPSTLGTFLRAFTHGHVQQLDAVGGRLLAGLAAQTPGLLTGGAKGGMVFVDVDDTIGEVHGYAKQAAAYGYSRVRGLNVQLATLSTPIAAPVIARARLRAGNTASAAGAGRMLAQAITTARGAGATGQVLARADSAYYGWAFVGTAVRARAWFSVTARMTPAVTAAITNIGEDAWTPISYPHAVFDEAEQRWVSDAEVAEIGFTAFTGRRKCEHVACRLVVRRVKRLQPLASDGSQQGELFATYRHHAFITNSTLTTVEADQRHRDHAIVEQVIAELKDGPPAHLPSGKYAANAAWVSCAVIAFNLARGRGRGRPDQSPLGKLTHQDHQRSCPDRRDRPPPGPAPSHRMALGARLDPAVVDRDLTPESHHLTNQPQRARPRNTSGRAGQTGSTATPKPRKPEQTPMNNQAGGSGLSCRGVGLQRCHRRGGGPGQFGGDDHRRRRRPYRAAAGGDGGPGDLKSHPGVTMN